MIKSAQNCTSMHEVRAGVDEIDQQLVALLATRQTFMSAAARIKSQRNEVYDQARIEDVIGKVKAHARQHGLCPTIAESVWRELIKQSIAFELKQWDQLHK